jgi:hypothetical protein
MPKSIVWTGQAKADIRGIEQSIAIQILKTLGRPLIRLRAQDHGIFFRDQGDHLKIERVLDRKDAYRN